MNLGPKPGPGTELALGRQQDDHFDLVAVVRQRYGVVVGPLCVGQRRRLVHHRRRYRAAVEKVKGAVPRGTRIERPGPGRVEIHCVGQDQPGRSIQDAGRDQFLDPVLGLLADPVVDRFASFLLPGKVQAPHLGAIVGGQEIEELGLELIVLLAPQGIRDVQPEALPIGAARALAAPVELLIESVKGRMQLRLQGPRAPQV
jgi:hypothetical protein